MSPPPERVTKRAPSVDGKKKKIDNCIARKYKEVYIFRYIDEYEKANKIHISEKVKLIWLIQSKRR